MKFLRFWFPVFFYCGIIFGVSAIPSVQLPPAIPYFDKFVHAVEYALLAGLLARAVINTNQKAWFPLVFGAIASLAAALSAGQVNTLDQALTAFLVGLGAGGVSSSARDVVVGK